MILLFCLMVALGDEIHQAFMPGRSFRVHDIGIDVLGAWLVEGGSRGRSGREGITN